MELKSTEYHEFQFSWLVVGIMLAVEALIVFFYVTQFGDTPINLQALLSFSAFFLLILSMFYGMTTTVNGSGDFGFSTQVSSPSCTRSPTSRGTPLSRVLREIEGVTVTRTSGASTVRRAP